MTPSDAALGGTEPRRDAIQGLADIVSRGHAAVTVLIEELQGGFNDPMDVRPVAGGTVDGWAAQIADALGEARGRIVAVTSERPGLAAHVALGLAEQLADAGAPVTVVDGSIEEPVFAKGLPEDGEEGLVDAVLFGVSSSTVARRTLMHGVRLVTAGSYPISVPAVLGAEAYRTTLQKLAREDATVLLVLPATYASVAASAASQLVIVGRDLATVERLSRDLRSAEDLRDVRFVTVLSAPEPPPVVEVPAPEARTSEKEHGGGEPLVIDAPPDDATPDGGVTREPVVVTANTAFLPDSPPDQHEDAPLEGERPAGRRWGGLVTAIVILLIAGVAWRTGIVDRLLSDDGDDPIPVVTPEETVAQGSSEAASVDSLTGSTDALQADDPGVTEAMALDGVTGVEDDAPAQQESETADTQLRDWRALAVSGAVPGRYVVFTSSHRLISAADRDAGALERRGFPSRVVDVDIPERGMWHRVAVDAGFRTLDDTRELLDIMKDVGYEGAWIERLREPAPPVVAPPDTTERWMDEGDAPQ